MTASAVTAQNVIANQYSLGTQGWNSSRRPVFDEQGNYYIFSNVGLINPNWSTGNLPAEKRGEEYGVVSKFTSNHVMQWCKSIGGDSIDRFGGFEKVQDGFLICGYSNSPISGTKTIESNGRYHLWLQKMDFNGEVAWQKGYYTDSNIVNATMISLGNDQFLISASTDSGISGDKTSLGYGGKDGWLIKIDGQGNVLWDKSIGTAENDFGFQIGGIFDNSDVLIYCLSMHGISGAKTEPNLGQFNTWLMRLNGQTGEIIWSKVIGCGGQGETSSNIGVKNNEIYLFATSNNGVSGHRTLPLKGFSDVWLVILNENGEISNQKCFGGAGGERVGVLTFHENYILFPCSSSSNTSIDKTENSRGVWDVWFLKLDLDGNLISQKTLGGNNQDYQGSVAVSPNGNYLLSCPSQSGISGEKTTPIISTAYSDVWIVEIDAVTLNVVENQALTNSYTVFPNPVKDNCSISFNEPIALMAVVLYDAQGRIIKTQHFTEEENTNFVFNVKGVAKGNYLLHLNGKHLNKIQQIVVE